MQSKAKSYFFLMMGIFLLGVFLHLLIPLTFVVESTKKIEQAYNGYKVGVQQITVRALAILNSYILSNQIQVYQNIRSAAVNMYKLQGLSEDVDASINQLQLYNATQLANMSNQQLATMELNRSMWFVNSVNISDIQSVMLYQYTQIEPYFKSMGIGGAFLEGLKSIQIYLQHQQDQIYFQYPSSRQQKFQDLNFTVFDQYFINTSMNFHNSGKIQTIFQTNESIKDCSIVNDVDFFAVFCLKLDSQIITSKIASILIIPDFQLSTSEYFIIRPLYDCQDLQYPQIISSFKSNQLSAINVPDQQYFMDFSTNQSDYLFNTTVNYYMNVHQLNITRTYYVLPITTYNNIDTLDITLYMVIVSNFQKSQLNNQSRYQQFFIIMIVPSAILFIIAALSMGFLMRPIFAKLHHSVTIMNEYCHFIKRNDMNLQITQEGETSDILQILISLKNLNLTNKLCTPSYLQVSCNERIMRLLRAVQLFQNFNYDKVNLYQNLAMCYKNKGELLNAYKYLKLSVDFTLIQLGGLYGLQKKIKEETQKQLEEKTQRKSLSKKQNLVIRNFRYKLYKLCLLQYEMYQPADKQLLQQMQKNTNLLKGLSCRSPLHIVQCCYSFILYSICYLESGQDSLKDVEQKIEKSAEMIKTIQKFKAQNKIIVPVEIIISYWHYLKAKFLSKKGEDSQSYQNLILALNGQYFDPQLHQKIRHQIQRLVKKYKIKGIQIHETFKYLNRSNAQTSSRYFIFLSDTSNPKMKKRQVIQWKVQARKMGIFIFDSYIESKDKICICEFCNELKITCQLMQKQTSISMLRKEIKRFIKVRIQSSYSQFFINLQKIIQLTKHIKKQKIYIFFLKNGQTVDSSLILEQISMLENSIFIFLVQEPNYRIHKINQNFYKIDFLNFSDIDIILGQKIIKKADNVTHLF